MKKNALKKFFSVTKLKLQLLKVWFMKNLVVWAQAALIVCIVLILTGNITADTPLLGALIYPIFQPLVDQINEIVANRNSEGLMDFFAVAISVLTSIGLFTAKLRSISQEDIKSDKLKIAMIRAKLYFNEDGRLVKKIEKLSGQDIDGDEKADEKEVKEAGLVKKVFQSIKEFFIILSADFSGDEERASEEVMLKADLKDSSEALKDIEENVLKIGAKQLAVDTITDYIEEQIDDTKKSGGTEKEKTQRVSLLLKLKTRLDKKKEALAAKKLAKKEAKQAEEQKAAAEAQKQLVSAAPKAQPITQGRSYYDQLTAAQTTAKKETKTTSNDPVKNYLNSLG